MNSEDVNIVKKPGNFAILIGILFILIGLLFLIKPEFALRTMILVAAILALIKGITDIAVYFYLKNKGRDVRFTQLLIGILIILLGILLVFNSYFGIIFIGVIFAFWFAFESIATLSSLRFFTVKNGFSFWLLLILSLLSLVMSILLFIRPFYAALGFTIVVGLFFLFQGIVLTLISIKYKSWFIEK